MSRLGLALAGATYAAVVGLLTFCQPADKRAEQVDAAVSPEKQPHYAFANFDPSTRYVGSEACAECHAEIYHTFKQTGKGRAFSKPTRGEGPEQFGGAHSVVFDTFSQRYYRALWRGAEMRIAEWQLGATSTDTTHYREERVDYVIGSGNQTRSFLMARNGYFYELPITWYSARRIWDLSPGYENGRNSGFSRTVGAQCIGCHNSQNQFVPNSVNRFTSVGNGMSCEVCHGAGEKHVLKYRVASSEYRGSRKKTDSQLATHNSQLDSSIVNPAHLPVTAQLDVCRQCHLEGVVVEKLGRQLTDFRPGMALADFADVFIASKPGAAPTQFGFASHAERLQLSACFRHSAGRLTCTTCHNPHQPLGPQPMAVYNAQCQRCHAEASPQACDAPRNERVSVGDDCVKCHMARSGTTDIPHVSSRDHLIRRKLGQEAAPAPEATAKSQLVVLRSFTVSDDSAADDRARAVAATIYFEQFEQKPEYLAAVRREAKALELDARAKYAYLAHDPQVAALPADLTTAQVKNPYTAFYISQLRKQQGQPWLPWLDHAVALAPANPDFRFELAAAKAASGDNAGAEAAYRELLRLQPWHRRALLNLGYQRLLAGDFAEALKLTREAKRQDPTYALAYENEANIFLQQGKANEALRLLDELIRRFPPQAAKYRELKARVQAAVKGS